MSTKSDAIREVVGLAGGKIVGKTRLQKASFILELAGVGFDFPFLYYHYGPYSDELSWAIKDAVIDGMIVEKEERAKWGGWFSIFQLPQGDTFVPDDSEVARVRASILHIAAEADPIALELAATAALLKKEGTDDWWGETARRKPLKATPSAIAESKKLWAALRAVDSPVALEKLN